MQFADACIFNILIPQKTGFFIIVFVKNGEYEWQIKQRKTKT